MNTATPFLDRRWRGAFLAVSLLVSVHYVRAVEPIGARATDQDYEPVWRSIEAELRTIPSIAHGLEPGQVESTGFEEEDGWVPGWFCGPEFAEICHPDPDGMGDAGPKCEIENPNPQGWWASGSAMSCREPRIDTVNPAEGTQHLRFSQDPSFWHKESGCPSFSAQCRISAFTPVTGPHPIGPTTVSIEVAGSASFGSDLVYHAQQPISQGVTGLFRFGYYGTILIYDNINGGYADTGVYWSTGGEYTNATISSQPCEDPPMLRYFYGGELIFEREQGGAFSGNTVEGVVFLTDNFGETWDIDNFTVTRDEPCPTVCGDGIVEFAEECDPGDDSPCPGRCIPAGEENECTCALIAGTCEAASELPNGVTEFPPTHGGWFTWVADVPSYGVNTCGSTGFDSLITVWTGECDSLELLVTNDDCDDDPQGCCGAGADPLASCHPVGPPWESCTCIDTTPGQRYWAQVINADIVGSVANVELDKRLECGSLWENGACCDGGTCTDDIADGDCQGGLKEWHAQKVCEAVFCRTEAIPTVSDWGLVILTLLGLAVGTRLFRNSKAIGGDNQP